MKSKLKVIALGVICLAGPASAENLLQVYQQALTNDPKFVGAMHVHESAQEAVKQAYSQMMPNVAIEYTHAYINGEEQDEGDFLFLTQRNRENEYDYEEVALRLNQTLFDWGIYKSVKKAKSEVSRADAEFEAQKQDLILRTAERYLQALAAADAIRFAEAEKAAVNKQLQLVEAMMKNGTARKTELYDAQARFASVEANEIKARADYADRLEALYELTGTYLASVDKLKDSIDLAAPKPSGMQNWIDDSLKVNPRVVQQLRNVTAAKHQISIEKSGHLPKLQLYGEAKESKDPTRLTGSGGDDSSESKAVFLNLRIPVFSGGATRSKTRQAAQAHQKALQDLQEVRRAVLRSIKAAYMGVTSAISRADALTKSLNAQSLTLESKQKGFRSGLYTGIDVLDAEKDFYMVKRDLAVARYDYLINTLRLKHASGALSEIDLQTINQWLVK